MSQGRIEEAVAAYRRVVGADPSSAGARGNLGLLLVSLSEKKGKQGGMLRNSPELIEGVEHIRFALAGLPVSATKLLRQYASVALEHLAKSEEAVTMLREGVMQFPNDPDLWYSLGRHLDTVGELAAAIEAYRTSHALRPSATSLVRLSALKTFTHDDPDLAEMEALLPQIEGKDKAYLAFGIGKALDDIKDRERAFEMMKYANGLMHEISLRMVGGNPIPAFQMRYEQMAAVFKDAGFGNSMPTMDNSPIFIVGMPRSGSTLIEKILASHSQVFAAGEDTALTGVILKMTEEIGSRTNELDRALLFRQYGERYVQTMRDALHFQEPRFVDKMLENFWQLGWLRMMLPAARIVHAVRDPVDTCLSEYKQPFEGLLGVLTSDLVTCAQYYKIYHKMMRHWHAKLPAGSILHMRYEELVADQEGQTRVLLDFAGLPFESETLTFYQSNGTRSINTASVAQVRQPIYNTAVRRWEKYRHHLKPLLDELGDLEQYLDWGEPEIPGAKPANRDTEEL